MDIMTHARFHFNRLMSTLIFGIRACESPPRAWRTTEKAGPDRVKTRGRVSTVHFSLQLLNNMHVTELF